MKRIYIPMVIALFAAIGISAQESSWEYFGSETVSASMSVNGDYDSGFTSETRLGIEYISGTGPGFRAEGSMTWGFGRDSMEAIAFDSGLATPPLPGTLPPGTDLHRKIILEQAYAKFSYSMVDAKFGLVPISWGSGYAFNPLALVNAPEFPGTDEDAVEGRLGATAAVSLFGFLSLEGYALAEPRLRSPVPSMEEVCTDDFPFGTRILARLEVIDVSIAFGRSLMAAGTDAAWFTGMDATGFLGPVTLYAETAARIMAKDGDSYAAFKAEEDIDACAGLSYLIPFVETTLRLEGAWLGRGEDEADLYDRLEILAGTKAMLGKAYGFAMLEKEIDDRFKASAGTLMNLHDQSAAWLAEASWSPEPSLEIGLSGIYFSGKAESEFGGTMATGIETKWDPFIQALRLQLKASF